jgi:hypothetical protein
MNKTLIIHPKDKTTDFLEIVYNPIVEKTVIKGNVTRSELIDLIKSHDRIMMMGHGSPEGLFSVGKFPDFGGYVIDKKIVSHLKNKKENIYIWCNADQFVKNNNLFGFYSGMFISEVSEAYYCGLYGTSQDIVDESNYGFCHILSEYIDNDKNSIYNNVKTEYGVIAGDNPVAFYNNKRLYVN